MPESSLDVRVYYSAPKAEDGTVMVCHHGAGWSGLTFACFAKEVTRISKGECGMLAFDARGHGWFVYWPRVTFLLTEVICRQDNIVYPTLWRRRSLHRDTHL